MTEEDIKEINKVARMINGGAIAEKFDFVIEQISRIAVDYRISTPIHKTINPMLNDMIRQLNSMKNNVMACMIGKDDTPMKVAQTREEIVTKTPLDQKTGEMVESAIEKMTKEQGWF